MPDIDRRLIDAVNLLGEYAEQHLPDGFTITLEFRQSECCLSLEDEDVNDIEVMSDDGSMFRLACEDAQERVADVPR